MLSAIWIVLAVLAIAAAGYVVLAIAFTARYILYVRARRQWYIEHGNRKIHPSKTDTDA